MIEMDILIGEARRDWFSQLVASLLSLKLLFDTTPNLFLIEQIEIEGFTCISVYSFFLLTDLVRFLLPFVFFLSHLHVGYSSFTHVWHNDFCHFSFMNRKSWKAQNKEKTRQRIESQRNFLSKLMLSNLVED